MTAFALPSAVTLVEVGARDGLQNEKQPVSTADKLELIKRLQAAGSRCIEATAFVSPKWVPQMADHAQVMAGLARREGVCYSALVPNAQGLEAALRARVDEVVIFPAASESFCRRNLNGSLDEVMTRFAAVAHGAREAGLRVRGVISCCLGCPLEGEVALAQVERVVLGLRDLGVDHIGIADTIGVGTPAKVQDVMRMTLGHFPAERISGHFHDTYGQALANVYASLLVGIHHFDTSIAGLGGCPYAPGATGNVSTEDVVYMLHGLGIDTGLDLDALIDTGQWISDRLGRQNASRVGRAVLAKRA
jgi:hydroxymethylglutaryl-CoA lyase